LNFTGNESAVIAILLVDGNVDGNFIVVFRGLNRVADYQVGPGYFPERNDFLTHLHRLDMTHSKLALSQFGLGLPDVK
jgi:hypothetical protein